MTTLVGAVLLAAQGGGGQMLGCGVFLFFKQSTPATLGYTRAQASNKREENKLFDAHFGGDFAFVPPKDMCISFAGTTMMNNCNPQIHFALPQ